jgi:hypothetical protein
MMPPAMPFDSLPAIGYVTLLAAVAAALEWTARRVHRRSEAFHTASFNYHADRDLWRCPSGEHLHRQSVGHARARVYRAPAHVCNRCALKSQCTDSDRGRMLEIQPDAWVNSTMARFHRGLSLVLLLLGELVLAVEFVRASAASPAPNRHVVWLLGALMLILGAIVVRLSRRFLSHPSS